MRIDVLLVLGITVCGCSTSITTGVDAGTPPSLCARASDCDTAMCIAGTCTATVSCSSSRMCPGLLCDTALGVCTECVGDSDCLTSARCRSGVCETAVMCGSDRDCSAADAVCDLAAGVCVECNADADCTALRFCAPDHSCPLRVCVPLATACMGAAVAACAANGSGFGEPTPCPSGDCADGACTELDGGISDAGETDAGERDAGFDAAAEDAGHDASVFGVWEELPAGGGVGYPGYSDFSPPGATTFYASSSDTTSSFARFDGSAWTPFASPSSGFGSPGYFAGPAWVGTSLYLIAVGNVYRYDIAADTWSTPLASVAMTNWAQNTHDESGHVFAITMDDRVATYNVASNTISYQAFGMVPPATGPRLAWDGGLLYVAPNISLPNMFSFDPATGAIVALASLPASRTTPTFCSDRSGHLYAAGDNTGTEMWQYDIATDTWTALPSLPFDHNANGACTVTASGHLYVTDNGTRLARLAL